MRRHEMKLHDRPFRRIQAGIQKIESRLLDEKRKKIHIGDVIIFTHRENPEEQIHTIVTGLSYYPTFNNLYKDLHAKYFPQYKWEELENSMYQYYTPEEEDAYGTVAIHVELISKPL